MRKGRFNEDQIISVLKEHQAGIPVVASRVEIRKRLRSNSEHAARNLFRSG